jgi:hypothetical protein
MTTQAPFWSGSQTATLHSFGTGVAEQSFGAPRQVPFWQIAFSMQMSADVHGDPLGTGVPMQASCVSSHVTCRQVSIDPGHLIASPDSHIPPSHVSSTVQ